MLTAKINSLLRTKSLFEEQRQQKEALMDYRQQGFFEVGRRIQADIRGRYVPIVFVTEATSDENLQKCLDIGVDNFD